MILIKKIFFHAALLVTSFAFVCVFSYSTSFAYDMLGGDSAIFQAIGKGWTQGYLPYVDLFDHKGPLIFFINALGYMIYPRVGIMALQVLCLYLSCLFMWRAMELYSSSRWKILFLLFALIYYAVHYEEGNHVEEYDVLFLSAAAYCFLRSLKENNFRPLYAFVYGLGFGACLMIRLSDAAQICCQVFLVALFLLQARAFQSLWRNVLNFCAGAVLIVLPFVIDFAAHDALYDMIYGTLLFNMKYANDASSHFPLAIQLTYNLIHLLPFFVMIIVAALALKDNPKSRLLLSGLFIGAMLSLMLMCLRPSDQYAMIFLAVAPILFAVLQESKDALQRIWSASRFSVKKVFLQLLIILCVIQGFMMTFYVKAQCLNEPTVLSIFFSGFAKLEELHNSDERRNVLKLQALIPDNERKSFVIWGAWNTGAHWILQTDMVPCQRLFMNTGQCTKLDQQLRQEYFDDLRRSYPLWILYGMTPGRNLGEPLPYWTEDTELEQLLAEKYSLKGEAFIFPQAMKLYRLKD